MYTRRIDESAMKAVGERFKELRKRKGVSQMSVRIDTDYDIGLIEAGRANVTLGTLSHLCRYYGVTFEEFFKGL